MEVYKIRWTIEVFKETKQYLFWAKVSRKIFTHR